MAKSLGNLFFTIGADSKKFDATIAKSQKNITEFEKAAVKREKHVQTETKKTAIAYGAAAGAAAAFAFELVKSSALGGFLIATLTDGIEALIVGYMSFFSGLPEWAQVAVGASTLIIGGYVAWLLKHPAVLKDAFVGVWDWFTKVNFDPETWKMKTGFGKFLDNLKLSWQNFKNSMSTAWDWLYSGFISAWNYMAVQFAAFRVWLIAQWTALKLALANAWDWLYTGLQTAIQMGKAFLTPYFEWVIARAAAAKAAILGVGAAPVGGGAGGVPPVAGGPMGGGLSALGAGAGAAWTAAEAAIIATMTAALVSLHNLWAAGYGAPPPGVPGGGTGDAYQYGGYVQHTGMAMVHRGEYVVPLGQTPQSVDNSKNMTIPQIIVNVNSPQGLSFGGGVALGQDTRVAVVEAMRNVVGM